MASDERNLKKLTNKQLDDLRQEVIAEEIRRVEEDPNAFVVSATTSIEEDLKILDIILADNNISE